MDLQVLKDELATDPLAVGYAAMDDIVAAQRLNTPDRETDREDITAKQLASAVDPGDYTGLVGPDRAYFDMLVAADGVENKPWVRAKLRDLFPAGTATRRRIRDELLKRPGSRAEELGLGRVTPSDVANAKRM